LKRSAISILLLLLSVQLNAQIRESRDLLAALVKIENETDGFQAKLERGERLMKEAETNGLPRDSVFARLLHRVGVWRYYAKKDLQSAVLLTRESIKINLGGGQGAPAFAINSYNNLGIFFFDHHFNKEALQALDTVIILSGQFSGYAFYVPVARLLRAQTFSRLADYQQSIDEATIGIYSMKEPDDWTLMKLYMERAIAHAKFNRVQPAKADIDIAGALREMAAPDQSMMGDYFSTRALVAEKSGEKDSAAFYYEKALQCRRIFGDEAAIAAELSDIGIFYSEGMGQYSKGLEYYHKAELIATRSKMDIILANIYLNIADACNRLGRYGQSLEVCRKGLEILSGTSLENMTNPSRESIKSSRNIYLQFIMLSNKAEAAMLQSGETKDPVLVRQALETFYLADFSVDQLRYQQSSVSSKLFWSNKTRNFYRMAIETAYMANDSAAVLYFMEKSRAVLLNDKLNELGSLAYLPEKEAEQEQLLRLAVTTLETQLEDINQQDRSYDRLLNELLAAKERLILFRQQLAVRFPVYFQYKYNNQVPSIQDVRQKLLGEGQSYLSFFETDSLIYALLVTAKDTRFLKTSFPGYVDSLKRFTGLCRNRQLLNSNYKQYAALAYLFYQKMIRPLDIPPGRVIVSHDQNFIPLDGLTNDEKGEKYLLFNYLFSYTYSARYLIKLQQLTSGSGKGFLGIAPENFSPEASLTALTGSVQSLESIANSFSDAKLIRYKEASRNFFLQHAGDYGLLHVYAHARAGNDYEPQLYLSDSAIGVSELQYWSHPQVGLAFLAACETGAGELSIGEGINSIARSFAAVGVPATIATLWTADNKVMYRLSEKFYHFLGKGLSKDVALQQAKISLLNEGSGRNRLPYYWASVVLSGNTAPLDVHTTHTVSWYWAAAIALAAVLALLLAKKQILLKNRVTNK